MKFSSLPFDLVVRVLETMELSSAILKDTAKGFPYGGGWRETLEYRAETQRLLEERRSYYLSMMANGGYNIELVPEKLCDREMCLTAIYNDSSALRYVPQHLRDQMTD